MKQHIIITSSDQKYGDFVIDHWLHSLTDNVNLERIDVGILDYGLSTAQRFYLKQHGVRLIPGKKDAHVTVARFRDAGTFLSSNIYDQVMFTDGGDILFQSDISHLFNQDKTAYRATTEGIKSAFTLFVKDKFFSKKDTKVFYQSLLLNPMINAGVLLGSREKMLNLCKEVWKRIVDPSEFGPDQVVVNYILHRDGFVSLPPTYNFVISTMEDTVSVQDGIFKTSNGEIISIVHNAGNLSFFRPIEHFGYGKDRNLLKKNLYETLKQLHKTSQNLIQTQKNFLLTRSTFQKYIESIIPDFRNGMNNEKINNRLNQLIKVLIKK